MPQLIWTRSALHDVARLRAFLILKNPDAGRRAAAAIRESVKLLAHHPEAGRLRDDMPGDFREWVITFGAAGYVALYRFDRNRVTILAVRHGREARF